LLDDEEAEHLPGCNLAVTQHAFKAIGGFDPEFHTAGDDVDFCWRLRAAGFRLGFAPGAFVWHWRRPSLRAFLRQQRGYGRAERLLIAKHPTNFSPAGGAKWQGFVYGGGPVRVMAGSLIDYGPMGTAGYQAVVNRMLPLRDLNPRFDHPLVRTALRAVMWLAPRLRAWERNRSLRPEGEHPPADSPHHPQAEQSGDDHDLTKTPAREFGIDGPAREQLLPRLLAAGWQAGGPTDSWDATQHGARLLLATEHDDDGHKRTLVRARLDASDVKRTRRA